MHEQSPYYDALRAKLHVRLPNITIEPEEDAPSEASGEPLRILFVGNHFGRKGGCVTLRVAELALEKKLPLNFDIVSKFEVGSRSWTDPTDPAYFDRYRKLLALPNVRNHGLLPNNAVIALVRKSHFSILTTFSDTFGFGAIEAMAHYTPVIATAQGSLPEFIQDGYNGVLLDFETDELGEWIHLHDDRSTAAYAELHREEIERLARAALARVVDITSNAAAYRALRQNARATAIKLFSADDANCYWDSLYERAMEGVVTP